MIPRMTKEEIKKSALEHGGYECPELNDTLYLHYKGYERIENLDEYTDVKTLWLDSNGFHQIENLSHLTKLRCLFLQKNLFSSIENLDSLNNLVQLDLSENRISTINGISNLPNLTTLNVAKNVLMDGNSIKHLTDCMKLSSVDLSKNHLKGDNIIEILSEMEGLIALNMEGNPVVTEISNFRKRCINAISTLRYLDRPVFEFDRISAEAWGIGGNEAELKAKNDWKQKEQEKNRKSLEDFRSWQTSIRAKKQKELLDIKTNGMTETQRNEKEKRDRKKQERLEAAKAEARKEKKLYEISSFDLDGGGMGLVKAIGGSYEVVIDNEETNTDVLETASKVDIITSETKDDKVVEEKVVSVQSLLAKSCGKDKTMPVIKTTEQTDFLKKMCPSKNNPKKTNTENSTKSKKEYHNKAPQDIVQESLKIYYKRKENNECIKSLINVSQGNNIANDKSILVCKGLNSTEKSTSWTKNMDEQLSKYVMECMYDFDKISSKMSNYENETNAMNFSALSCRLRWCELDSASNQTKREENSQETIFIKEPKLCSLEDLETFALSKPSAHIHPPKIFPSLVDDDAICSNSQEDIMLIKEYYKTMMLSDPLNNDTPEDWQYFADRIHQVKSKI